MFFETIDKFLSKPQLQTTSAVDAIIEALHQGNFFPTNQIADIRNIVETEIAVLHDEALPYLIRKLIESHEAQANVKSPARSFLSGLAALKQERIRSELKKTIIIGKAHTDKYASVIVSLLRVDSELATVLDPVTLKRICKLLLSLIDDTNSSENVSRLSHPLGWLTAFVKARGQAETWRDYRSVVEALTDKYLYDPELMKIIAGAGPIQDAYFDLFLKRARSSQFHTANPAANSVPVLSEMLGIGISPEMAFRVVAAVTKAAEYNAFEARALRDGGFSGAKTIRQRAAEFCGSSSAEADAILDKYGVVESLENVAVMLTS